MSLLRFRADCLRRKPMRINGTWRDDGTFIGFDYAHQHWYDTDPDGEHDIMAPPGTARNPIAVIPVGAEIVPD